jgi:protein-disulfide isomerase
MSGTVPSQRGRKVVTPKRNPLLPFYLGVGALLLVGAAFLITYLVRSNNSASDTPALTAPVGQTADGFWYKGSPDAPVKVIKYSDYQCPACRFYFNNLGKIIQRDYIETGKVQFIYHEFPLDVHPHAVAAGEAARCAGDQNKYWQMHDILFTNQDQWAPLSTVKNVFSGYAGQIGLNRAEFDACVANGAHNAEILAAGKSSIEAGVQATPTFSVNGQLTDATGLPGAIEVALRTAGQ